MCCIHQLIVCHCVQRYMLGPAQQENLEGKVARLSVVLLGFSLEACLRFEGVYWTAPFCARVA